MRAFIAAAATIASIVVAQEIDTDLEARSLGDTMEIPAENCPTGHNTLWTLTAVVKEMSTVVRDLQQRAIVLEGETAGILAMHGTATISYRNSRALLSLVDETVELTKLVRATAGQVMVGQDSASTRYMDVNGDAELSANATLDLTTGAVSLDEIQGLPAGQIIVGVDGTAPGNARVNLNGDAIMDSSGAVTILPNRVGLAKISRSNEPGQLIVSQGRNSDLRFKTITGDATMSNGGVLTLTPGSVQADEIAVLSITRDHIRPNVVESSKILDGAVMTSKLAEGAVVTSKITDGSVTAAKLAPGAISLEVLFQSISPDGASDAGKVLMFDEAGSVSPMRIRHDASIGSTGMLSIAENAITTLKLADGAVNAPKILDGSVSSAKLADGAVTSDKLLLETLTVQSGPGTNTTVDLLTLLNANRAASMAGMQASLKFRQLYYADIARPADAADISAGPTTDWTEDVSTHSSFAAVSISDGGAMEQRLRVEPRSTMIGQPASVQSEALDHTFTVGAAMAVRGAMRVSVAAVETADAIVFPGWAAVVVASRPPSALTASANVFSLPSSGVGVGQTLTVINYDGAALVHDGALPDVAALYSAVYIFLGDKWVMTSYQPVHDTVSG